MITRAPQEIAQIVETGEALAMKDAYSALAAYRPEMGASIEEVDGAVSCVLARQNLAHSLPHWSSVVPPIEV